MNRRAITAVSGTTKISILWSRRIYGSKNSVKSLKQRQSQGFRSGKLGSQAEQNCQPVPLMNCWTNVSCVPNHYLPWVSCSSIATLAQKEVDRGWRLRTLKIQRQKVANTSRHTVVNEASGIKDGRKTAEGSKHNLKLQLASKQKLPPPPHTQSSYKEFFFKVASRHELGN